MSRYRFAALVAMALAAMPACANEEDGRGPVWSWFGDWGPSFYAGAGVHQARFDDWGVVSQVDAATYTSRERDDEDTGARISGGMVFREHFALEAAYADFGGATFMGVSDGSGGVWEPVSATPVRWAGTPAFATPERFPDVPVLAEWPDEALPRLGLDRYTALLALTHDPKIDDPALTAALRAECFYIGALGSKKTHARRVERLHEAGFAEAGIARIHAPIGLDIGAVSPAEIALSILGEIVATLRKDRRRTP